MKTSQKGIDFIKEVEGFEPKEYNCPGGKKTIGYGHVLGKGEKYPNGISNKLAEKLLATDIKIAETTINKLVKVTLTQNQYDSLVSLIFNWGSGNFRKSEGLKKLNKGDYEGAIKEFSEVTNNGLLVGRRKKEAEMWNEKEDYLKDSINIKKDSENGEYYFIEDSENGECYFINKSGKKLVTEIEEKGDILKRELEFNKIKVIESAKNVEIEAIKLQKALEEELEKQKKQKYYRLLIISICLIILGIIVFSYYKASAKPLEGEYNTCFTPPEQCGDLIVKHINGAKKTIYMQAYGFTSGKIIASLLEAKKRGVDVQIILDRSNMSNIKLTRLKVLTKYGIVLYQDKVLGIAHNKVIIIDENIVITGSFNFTENADTRNAENIIIISNKEVAKDYLNNWNNRNKEKIK